MNRRWIGFGAALLSGLSALLVGLVCARPAAAEAVLKAGDYVAIVGDSITEQRLYSVYMEDYLLMCQPAAQLQTTQFGWGGETSLGVCRPDDERHAPFCSQRGHDLLRHE